MFLWDTWEIFFSRGNSIYFFKGICVFSWINNSLQEFRRGYSLSIKCMIMIILYLPRLKNCILNYLYFKGSFIYCHIHILLLQEQVSELMSRQKTNSSKILFDVVQMLVELQVLTICTKIHTKNHLSLYAYQISCHFKISRRHYIISFS